MTKTGQNTPRTTLRWGILATGNIAHAFASDLALVDGSACVAVGSRTAEAAATFGAQYNIPHRHASYQALAEDPDVDIIYISTPHPAHYENTLLCLNHGKHVLCEKAFAMNEEQARDMFEMAREKNLFLMEAMWMYCFPSMNLLRTRLAEGVIGEPKLVEAKFGFRKDLDPNGRLLNPHLGGGALLDLGVYPISLAQFIFQDHPAKIASSCSFSDTGVDEQNAMLLQYPGGGAAVLTSAMSTPLVSSATIYGTEGRIEIPPVFLNSNAFSIHKDGHEEHFTDKKFGLGYTYQIQHVENCLQKGLQESPLLPASHTLEVMGIMDTMRRQWGLKYPSE